MWKSGSAYLRITPYKGHAGAWGKLFDRNAQEACELPCPQEIFILQDDTADYEAYQGPRDAADTLP